MCGGILKNEPMKKYIIANWKNHPDTLAEAKQILDATDEYLGSLNEREMFPNLIFCPPFEFVEEVSKILQTSHLEHYSGLGAQDIFLENNGSVLSNLGVRHVIVGHSDRRWRIGETDEVVNKKLKAVLKDGMIPIVCVGEKVRDEKFKEFLEQQVLATFDGLTADELGRCLIAYEPVWAISTNPDAHPDTPDSALESIAVIGETLTVNGHKGHCLASHGCCKLETKNLPLFLYGGSVTSKNVGDFVSQKEIDGVLVGSASVNKEEFLKILRYFAQNKTPF